MPSRIFFLSLLCMAAAGTSWAGALTEAKVTKIINDVRVADPARGTHPAALEETIKDQIVLKTGVKSRSELRFQDATLTRLGPETSFSFKAGTRDISLEQGTMLLQVPKGIGGAKIRTAAVTAAITGTTIMMEYRPNRSIKVLVLEGSLRLSVNGRFGDSLLLLPGKMVIMPPDAKHIPEPVSVDLAKVVKTSALVKMDKSKAAPLPSMAMIDHEIATQLKEKDGNSLINTNLLIAGGGTKVIMEPGDITGTLDKKVGATDRLPSQALNQPLPDHSPAPTPAARATPSSTPGPHASPTPNPTATPSPTPTPTATPSPTPGDDEDGDFDDVVNIGADAAGDVTVNDPIDLSADGHRGKVKINSHGTVSVNTLIKVSDSAGSSPSHRGGDIEIKSHKTTDTAINISSSAQLLSLLNAAAPGPGGRITFQSQGGAINVTGSTVRADRGTIDIKNTGRSGIIVLDGATLSASTIKIHALGKDGQLNVGGGSISADDTILLYAGGSNGTVNFTDNVSLNGASVKTISGNTVTIRDGRTVTIGGPNPANVFTNHPNYSGSGGNNSTTGTFGGAGATTHPLSGAPGG